MEFAVTSTAPTLRPAFQELRLSEECANILKTVFETIQSEEKS